MPSDAGWAESARPERYFPALDGIRALAVGAVLVYHLGVPGAGGGYLGVDVFFVLSGYLITGILFGGRTRENHVALRSFWARRARRLLPALFLMLLVVTAASYLDRSAINLHQFRWDALATLFYSANWHEIVANQSYFAQFAAPSPLAHTWSLAIEEQFYLLWPLVLAGCLALSARGRGQPSGARPRRRAVAMTSAVLAVASALSMALAYRGPSNASTVYFATQTRAFELLVGALLAVLLHDRPVPGRRAGWILSGGGWLGLGTLLLIGAEASGPPGWMFRGGFLTACVAASLVIAAAGRQEPGAMGRLLGSQPLRYLGRISYGIYLWHWPVIVVMTPSTVGLSGWSLDLARTAVTLAAAAASFHLVEQPLRRADYAGWFRRALAPASVALTGATIVVGTLPAAAVTVAGASGRHQSAYSTSRPQTGGPASVAGGPYGILPTARLSDPLPTPDPGHPLRILVVGDSVMWTAEPALAAALTSTGEASVDSAAFFGWGLTTAKNWHTQFAQLLAQYHPDVAMGTWSWDDPAALADPRQYASTLSSFVDELLAPGSGVHAVILFQFPPLGPLWSIVPDAAKSNQKRAAGVRAWNAVAHQVADAHPGRVLFVTVAPAVEVNGSFSAWLPSGSGGWTRARMVDNTHFCPWGASVYSAAVTSSLDSVLHLPRPQGPWWSGSWTADPRYAQANGFPGGACPDDQPP